MKGVRRDSFGPPTKGLAERNHYSMRDDQSGVRDEITGEVNGLSVKEELRINEDAEGEIEIRRNMVRVQPVLHTHQQQPQGSLVCWDQFLPFRSLKILLVENDDSTRHVVSALLRNCSYQVTAVANGLAAWKILEDLTNHVDLVLTEVAMPYFSGIGLLSKIMNHKSRKNVPVIMMSSNDSMGIVFKCLSRGALDFLVKPIRKNELKNLWQHVWRKCHSSSGSGSGSASESESGIRTQKSTKFRSVEGSENSTDSNNQADEGENGSIGLNVRDESENGSGTQGSWSKRAVEVDSPQRISPDSTCAQAIHSRLEAPSANWVPTLSTRECHNEEDELGNAGMGKDLTIGGPRIPDLQVEGPTSKEVDGLAGSKKVKHLELDPNGNEKIDGNLQLNKETWKDGLKNKDAGHKAAITNTCNPQVESTANEVANDAIYEAKDLPSLELSLKQLRDVEDTGTSVQEHKVLRHSDLSAFSRYNGASTAKQTPTGNVGSCSPFNNSSEGGKTESMHNLRTNSSSVPDQRLNRSSNNNDMGSSTNNVSTKPETLTDKPITKSVVNVHPCSSFQPVQHGHNSNSLSQPMLSEKAGSAKAAVAQTQAMHQKVQVQHHHHHYHHYHHHVHNPKQQQNGSSERNLGVASHCGTSDMLGTPVEGNASNYESASGSNNGSNGQIGSSGQNRNSSVIIAGGTNIVTENGASEKSAVGSENGTATDLDQNRSAQREAALHKFRQKRKERCFEKKVRYESRKRLAEERPRVRGQFVRQAADKSKSNDTNC